MKVVYAGVFQTSTCLQSIRQPLRTGLELLMGISPRIYTECICVAATTLALFLLSDNLHQP